MILYLLVLSDQELVSLKQCWLVQICAILRPGLGWCKAGTVLNKQDCADWEGKGHCHEVAIPVLQGGTRYQEWWNDKVAETWKNLQRDPCLPS